ncbi:MAG: hypothetical protein FWB71_05970, partial [Defluviitaleaceae bacterium]|nr:hypothetical protein [Defluviitaleaceae bacterium]
MNTKDNRRVILVKGDESKWYEQAIFILRPGRDGAAGAPLDFVKEAERIVSGKAAPAAILTP